MITKKNLKNYNNLIAISNNNYEKFLKELKKEYKINIAYIGYNSGIYGWNFDVEKIYIIDKNNNIIEYFHLINGYRNYSSKGGNF